MKADSGSRTFLTLLAGLSAPLHPAYLFLPAMFFSIGNGLVLPNAIAGAASGRSLANRNTKA